MVCYATLFTDRNTTQLSFKTIDYGELKTTGHIALVAGLIYEDSHTVQSRGQRSELSLSGLYTGLNIWKWLKSLFLKDYGKTVIIITSSNVSTNLSIKLHILD